MITSLVILLGLFILTLILLLTCRDASHFNGLDKKLDENIFGAFFQRFYFITTTLTTIGYGDISPASIRARAILLIYIIVIVGMVIQALTGFATYIQKDIINRTKNDILSMIPATLQPHAEENNKFPSHKPK